MIVSLFEQCYSLILAGILGVAGKATVKSTASLS
jgi:hypothetical protein